MSKGKEAGKIQVYVRVRPFTAREKEKREANAIEIHQEHSLIRVLDPRTRTNYFFDGVFSPEASNQEVYLKVGKPLVFAALNGYKGTLLTYGQTGTGKTFTLLSDDGVTTRVVQHCFERIDNDEIHNYKVMCSFLQVYQEKVYDLLNPRLIMDLPVREHPKKGVYVANLTQHEVKSAGDVFALLEIGKQHLVIAETKMVRQSSRSHSIMQLIIERRLKVDIVNEKPARKHESSVSHEAVQESIMAVDETINNLIKELKQERKSHHKHERECLKELMEKELNNGNNFEGDLIVKGKINLCDLAGSERLTKTKAEGVRLTEAKYLNTSLLELGNVIHALARGQKRHVPYRNSTLTRLLQDCLGDNGKTNFIICIAPALSEVNETKCSLNFGLRAMRITNVARLNVEVDYKVLAERLAKKLEDQDIKSKIEKLEYLREIQRLKSAVTSYQENETFTGKDHEKLVSVIANLSKSVQREKEEKNNLQSELFCLKKQVSQPIGTSAPGVDAVLLAELMSMELLANLHHTDVTKSILTDSSLPAKVKGHLASVETQEALLHNTGCFLQLLDLYLETEHEMEAKKIATAEAKEYLHFNFSRAGSVELFSKDCSIKISPRGGPQEPCLSLPMCNTNTGENATGLAGGVRRMLGKLMGRDSKGRAPLPPSSSQPQRACVSGLDSATSQDVSASLLESEVMIKTKALMKQLASSKEKVEQQVLGLLSTLFGEPPICNQGHSPQWNELGKKLTKLLMFRRNNMPGLSDANPWAHSDDLNTIMENCLRFVIIDKALLACLLVVELHDLRQACGKSGERRLSPSIQKQMSVDINAKDESRTFADELYQDKSFTSSSQSETSSVKENCLLSTEKETKIATNRQRKEPSGQRGFRREDLKDLKDTKSELEKEITEIHEDTTKLETELFSTMEEKTKVEEELSGMKHHVTKLRSELFHLKLEKSNLEEDMKRSKSTNTHNLGSGETKSSLESPKEPRVYSELSDVTEASHESNESENSVQMSDGPESREAFLKTCMENISKIYTLMPNPEDGAQSGGELSDDQEPTLSDANIDDSEEEIIITKLGRSLRTPCTSPGKEVFREVPSSDTNSTKEAASSSDPRNKPDQAKDIAENLASTSKEALLRHTEERKRKLQKVEQELAEVREANEDLEYELDHKKGQLAEAQETITNLENQVFEEKENCEQVRQLYFDIKSQNEILDGKINALRSELNRALRDNNAVNGAERSLEPLKKPTIPPSPTKGPGKSPGKAGKARASKIDLRNPPQSQLTSNEMEIISLWEENAELKVKLGKANQEKTRLEKLLKGGEEKFLKMKAAFQSTEEAFNRVKVDVATSTEERLRLTGEVTDLRNLNSNLTEELNKYREKATHLENDIEGIAFLNARLEKDNKTLESEISRMELEISTWKGKQETVSLEFQRFKKESMNSTKGQEQIRIELEAVRKEKAQLLEQRFSAEEEKQKTENEMKDHEERFVELESTILEMKRVNLNLQKELAGMAEYQEALENEFSKAKNEEDRMKQELAKAKIRLKEFEKELSLASQNPTDATATTEIKEVTFKLGRDCGGRCSNSLKNITKNSRKHELDKKGKPITGTPSKKFYTITHTSEDEIADTSSSMAESPTDDAKVLEHENQLLKLENGYLQQQLSESEHILTMYREDLEGAQDLIDKLQTDAKTATCQKSSSENGMLARDDDFPQDEYKFLEEKHAELTRGYETLRRQYQEAVADKDKVPTEKEYSHLKKEFPGEVNAKHELLNSDTTRVQTALEERINELEAQNDKLKFTMRQLCEDENTKQKLLISLQNTNRGKSASEERIHDLECENQELMKLKDGRVNKEDPQWIQRTLEERIKVLEEENQRLRVEMAEFNENCHGVSFGMQKLKRECISREEIDNKMREIEDDLLKVTSEKLKLEFELKNANSDRERLRSDLLQSEYGRNLLNTQLNDNIERTANLEIRLMETRCSCETIKEEINTLKDRKRQESLQLQETSVCKEMLEKRLEDALKENHHLQQELESRNEERRGDHVTMTRLERERDLQRNEIEELRNIDHEQTQIEDTNTVMERTGEHDEIEALKDQGKVLNKKNISYQQKLAEYKTQNETDQETLKTILAEVFTMAAEHEQMKTELQEIKKVKTRLEEQLANVLSTTRENSDKVTLLSQQQPATTEMDSFHGQLENFEVKDITNATQQHQEETRLLEKEKSCLEKELGKLQGECNHLKEELRECKSSLENGVTPEKAKALEKHHSQVLLELEELRELNQRLEKERTVSTRTIEQLEVKAKALESFQQELHCFHEENDRLTQEVDIIQNTSKAMTNRELSKVSLETEKSLLLSQFQALKDHNRELQAQIDIMNKELKVDQEQCEKLNMVEKKNISLEDEVEKFKKLCDHLEREAVTAAGKVKDLEAVNDTLKKENKAMKGRTKNLDELHFKLQSGIVKGGNDSKVVVSAGKKSKGISKRGRQYKKESNEPFPEEKQDNKEMKSNLLREMEILRNEKLHLEEELNVLRQKCPKSALVDTVGTQTVETSRTQDTAEKRRTDEQTILEPEIHNSSAPLLEDMKVGFSVMAKEKLLLETKASHFARVQMHLEQSIVKGMKENAILKNKIKELENTQQLLRERVHELESTNAILLGTVDDRKNATISNDKRNDFGEERSATNDGKEEDQLAEPKNAECHIDVERTPVLKDTEGRCQTCPSQSSINELIEQKTRLLAELEDLQGKKQSLACSIRQQKENKIKLDGAEAWLEKQEQENVLLSQEKNSLVTELEAVKHQSYLLDNELRQKKESCRKQEDEMRLLLSSYNQEKDALLLELKNATSENREVREKLRELQRVELDFEDIQKKSKEAEQLVTELEKDLLSQTEIKNELTRELRICLNQLKDMELLEKQLQTSKKENEELSAINCQLKEEIVRQKDENSTLAFELINTKRQLRSMEKQKTLLSKLVDLQDQGVQTNSSFDKENLENKMQPNDVDKDKIEFLEDRRLTNGEQNGSFSDVLRSNCLNSHSDGKPLEKVMYQGTSATLRNQSVDSHAINANNTDECNPGKEIRNEEAASTNINTLDQTEFASAVETEISRNLDLSIEAFEKGAPREQSTPSEEKEQRSPRTSQSYQEDAQQVHLDSATQSLPEHDNTALGMSESHQAEAVNHSGQCLTELDLVSGIRPPTHGGTQSGINLLQLHLNLLRLEEQSQKASKDSGIALETTGQPEKSTNLGANDHTIFPDDRVEDNLSPTSTKHELEWTISNLKSDVQKLFEEKERGQHEIGLLEEEQLSMKRKVERLLSECESLRTKANILQTQNDAILKEQILNDEENEELHESLQELVKEKQAVEEAKRDLENEKARLEIELSDAIESREAIERELFRVKTEGTHDSQNKLEGQLHDRYSKLETVLSCVLDENSKMTTELSVLQAENRMLKGFKIMEITDNFTQFSPRTTEDESDGEGGKHLKSNRKGGRAHLAESRKQDSRNSSVNIWGSHLGENSRETFPSPFIGNPKSPLLTISRSSSPEPQEVGKRKSKFSSQTRADEEGSRAKDVSNDEVSKTPTPDVNVEDIAFAAHAAQENKSAYQGISSCGNEFSGKTQSKVTDHEQRIAGAHSEPSKVRSKERETAFLARSLKKKHHEKCSKGISSSRREADTTEDAGRRETDDNDSSMEACTTSSMVSATDLDISISSDQISSEDSSIVGPELRILQKMQKELAETKCNNVLVKNELSIIRKHNSELQNHVQKLQSRNNHLKQKICDRTLSVKRMEKEVHSIKDENKRLQEQSIVLKEEINRVEKEKAKFERNMSSTKSENKRLKTDLSNVKAECYRVMKELVNLQAENRRLQIEIEKNKEEAQRIKEAFSLESISQEMSLWEMASHGDLRSGSRRSLHDKPITAETFLNQREASALTYGQQEKQPDETHTLDLSPLMLPKGLHDEHADWSENRKGSLKQVQSEDTVSVASTDKLVSRQGSLLSFASEISVPEEFQDREKIETSGGKMEGEEACDEQDAKGKNKKTIKTILRKLQHSKKGKPFK